MHDMLKKTELLPAAALDSHVGILGKTGSGKSNAAKVLAERLMADGQRVCALDPTGTWWGLRLEAGGKKRSQFAPVIFGGDHGDIAIGRQHGAVLGEAIGTSADSAIIDTQQMKVGERVEFATEFAEALLRSNRGPLHLIIDEAHLFAPQGKVNDPQSGKMVHAFNNLVSLGRGRGLRIILISQRPAKMHKDSLTQVETLIAMRLIAPQDRAAIRDWVGEWADKAKGDEIIASLPSLPVGDAWVWAPQLDFLERKHFPLAVTYDSGTADANASARELPPIDTEKLGAKMDGIRQEAMANDPKRLKARIAELEREKAKTVPAVAEKVIINASEEQIAEAIQRGYKSGVAAEQQRLGQKVLDFAAQFALAAQETGSIAASAPRQSAPKAVAAPRRDAKPARAPVESDGSVTGPQLKVLGALAWWAAMGNDKPLRPQVAAICGWAASSGHLKNVLGSLSSAGLISYPAPGQVQITPEGSSVAPEPDMSMTVIDGVRAVLSGPQRALFEALLPGSQTPMDRSDLAEAVGWAPTSGHLKNTLGSLSTLQIITYPSRGSVALADWIFA